MNQDWQKLWKEENQRRVAEYQAQLDRYKGKVDEYAAQMDIDRKRALAILAVKMKLAIQAMPLIDLPPIPDPPETPKV
jgi:nitrate/nitrite-specific signal transduction histidine kinase